MSQKANYFKLGLFVIGALLSGVAVLLVIGSGRWFERKITIETYFNESVQGLDIGSKIKFNDAWITDGQFATGTPAKVTLSLTLFGNPVTNDDEPLKLLHYRYLGKAYHEARNARNWGRITPRQRQLRLGYETAPDWQGDYSARWYEEQRATAVNVC